MAREDMPGDEVTREAPVHGTCDTAFSRVREAFAENFVDRDELGACLHIRVDGRSVVDLYGGFADRERTRPWRDDTLVNAYSVGKGVLSLLALQLVERGEVDLDAPVAAVWPEFAEGGKQAVSLRVLMAHRGGLPSVRERLPAGAMYDWDRMCGAFAAQEPWWEPDSAHGYHVNSFGFLVGEVLRRSTGRSVPELLRKHLTGPLAADFHFGLPPSLHARVAHLDAPQVVLEGPEQWAMAFPPTGDPDHDLMIWHGYFNPTGISGMGTVNTRAWRGSVIPSTSGHADASAVAAIFDAALAGSVGGQRGVSPSLLGEAARVHSDGEDRVLGRPSRFGLGLQLSTPERRLGGPRGFGHYGYGGSLGFADPESRVAFGFLTSRPGDRWQTPRTQCLLNALEECL